MEVKNPAYYFNPMSYATTYKIASMMQHTYPKTKSIIDVGGVDSAMSNFIPVNLYINASLELGIDGRCLPFKDESVDVGLCLYTLEHIEPEDRLVVIDELIRVSKFGCFLAFPVGAVGCEIENIKAKIDHYHPIAGNALPDLKEIMKHVKGMRCVIFPDSDPISHMLMILALGNLSDEFGNDILVKLNSMYNGRHIKTGMSIEDAYSIIMWVDKSGT